MLNNIKDAWECPSFKDPVNHQLSRNKHYHRNTHNKVINANNSANVVRVAQSYSSRSPLATLSNSRCVSKQSQGNQMAHKEVYPWL